MKIVNQYRNSRFADQAGFTLVELMVAFMIVAILSTIGMYYYADVRARSADSQAFTEGRGMVTALNDAFLAEEDVYFGDGSTVVAGSGVGSLESDGSTSRTPIFTVSTDIRVRLDGDNDSSVAGDGYIMAEVWNITGSDDATTPSGKKEYTYIIDEGSGTVSTPTF